MHFLPFLNTLNLQKYLSVSSADKRIELKTLCTVVARVTTQPKYFISKPLKLTRLNYDQETEPECCLRGSTRGTKVSVRTVTRSTLPAVTITNLKSTVSPSAIWTNCQKMKKNFLPVVWLKYFELYSYVVEDKKVKSTGIPPVGKVYPSLWFIIR